MLGVITFVYSLSFFCNSGLKEIIVSSVKNHNHHNHDHHGHEHTHTDDHHPQSESSDKNDSNCCNESMVSFFASLKHSSDQKVSLSKLTLIDFFPSWNKISFDRVSYSFKRFSPQFLKRKVPDIRILIQSFLI